MALSWRTRLKQAATLASAQDVVGGAVRLLAEPVSCVDFCSLFELMLGVTSTRRLQPKRAGFPQDSSLVVGWRSTHGLTRRLPALANAHTNLFVPSAAEIPPLNP